MIKVQPIKKSTTLNLKSGIAKVIKFVSGVALIAFLSVPAIAEVCSWSDPNMDANQRAKLLMAASSLHQKYRWLNEAAANNPNQTNFYAFNLTNYSLVMSTYPVQVDCTPVIKYTDGPQGIRGAQGVTAFPAPIAMASTWNLSLSQQKGSAMAAEAWLKGRNMILGAGISSARTPLAGRTSEYFGEDPVLSGLMAGSEIKGIQSGNVNQPVGAVLKHFIGNEQETDRNNSSSNIGERSLQEIYNLPFYIALRVSAPRAIMCAYNGINQTPSCENPKLLNQYLKTESQYSGFVVSDFQAVKSTVASIRAGLDQELGADGPIYFTPENLDAAIASGDLTIADIDNAAFRVVVNLIKSGFFDRALLGSEADVAFSQEHKLIASNIVEQGSVLLKNNNNFLPIIGEGKTIAVIGAVASNHAVNGVSAVSACAATFNIPGFEPALSVDCSAINAPLEAIVKRAALDGSRVIYNAGTDIASAVKAAKSADIVLIFSHYETGEFTDRTDLHLDGNGDALIAAVANANPNTAVLLATGGPVIMPWLGKVKAVLETWYSGSESGSAIAKLLWGDVNPSGKLPISFPVSESDLPTAGSLAQFPGIVDSNGVRQIEFSEGMKVGYRWYESQNIKPLFPFGFGLSYTTFDYANGSVSPVISNGHAPVNISFVVRNTGGLAGFETAQVYLTLPRKAGQPSKRLAGWVKVALNPGEAKYLTVALDPKGITMPFSFWDIASKSWQISKGVYGVEIGSSSKDVRIKSNFTVN
jgi:beta-glucosidase